MTGLKEFLQAKNLRAEPVRKSDVIDGLRKSVVIVLSRSTEYSDLVKDATLVESITQSLFSSIYKKVGKVYYPRFDGSFTNMIDTVIFNTKKELQVREAKEQIARAASLICECGEESPVVKLGVVSSRIFDKLNENESRSLDFFESRFKDVVNSVVYAGSGLSLKQMPPRKDLLYLDLILVAEGTNKNRDTFLAEELESSYLTLIGMPLVEEHEPQAIKGIFYDSELVRIKDGKSPGSIKIVKNGGRLAVRAKAYVYKTRFPREVYMIKERQDSGLLRFSVELGFNKVECSVCHAVFKPGDKLCEHLLLRHELPELGATRIVRDVYFIGGAYTTNPAERRAVSLDVQDGADLVKASANLVNKSDTKCVKVLGSVDLNTNKFRSDVDLKASKDSDQQTTNDKTFGAGDASANSDGGKEMQFKFDSVEELLASQEVNALIEAKAADVMRDERDAFEASIAEANDKLEAANAKIAELEATVEDFTKQLNEANELVAQMQVEQKVSASILELQQAGYNFESDDELKAFSDKVRKMSDDQVAFVLDLMKKTVQAKTEEPVNEHEQENAAPENEDVVKASQRSDVHVSADKDTSIAAIRKSWRERINKLTGLE